jgi:hypothetical protein
MDSLTSIDAQYSCLNPLLVWNMCMQKIDYRTINFLATSSWYDFMIFMAIMYIVSVHVMIMSACKALQIQEM